MAIKIKKQYKQADGTIIEVEGSEAEVEAFEKKQQKQKAQIEQSEKKRTILYGKDLEALREIIRQELAKNPPTRIVYEYRYYQQPDWVRVPYIVSTTPTTTPSWYGASSTCTDAPAETTYTIATGSISANTAANVSTYAAQGHAVGNTISGKLLSDGAIGVSNAGWSVNTSNYLMSPQ